MCTSVPIPRADKSLHLPKGQRLVENPWRQMQGIKRARGGSRVIHHAGGRELRIDGSFASWYEPGRIITGSVWDAIAAGLLAIPAVRRRKILLLGLGGGSAARLARAVAPRAEITGVEIDAQVVRLARQHFDLDDLGIRVVVDDACEVLRSGRGRFDAILEDVFVGTGDDAEKPAGFPVPGLSQAVRRLRPGGVLVSNALDDAPATARTLSALLAHVVRIGIAGYDNRVFVASRLPLTARGLRAAVAAEPLLGPTLSKLHFRSLR